MSLTSTFFLVACDSSGNDKLSMYITEVKARKGKPITSIPPVAPVVKFSYPETESRRSPFKQKNDIKIDRFAPNQRRPKQLLEQFPLNVLKFVGILKQGTNVWGLISKPDGEIIRVRTGDYMGQNYGKILSISDTALQIEETIQVSGKWEKKQIIFKLQVLNLKLLNRKEA